MRWKSPAFKKLYPQDLGVIFEVVDEKKGLVRIHWLKTTRIGRAHEVFGDSDMIWPTSCMEIVES